MSHAAAPWHGTIVNTIAWYHCQYYIWHGTTVSTLWQCQYYGMVPLLILLHGTTVNTMTRYHCQQNGTAPLSMLLHGISGIIP